MICVEDFQQTRYPNLHLLFLRVASQTESDDTMDDLAGMDWSNSTSSTTNPQKKPPMNTSSAFGSFPSLQPTPSPFASGRNTPLSANASGHVGSAAFKAPAAAGAAPTKSAQDAFSNLMTMSSAKTNANMSLAERQKQLEAEKLKKMQEKQKQQAAAYGDGKFWDTLGQGSSSTGVSRTASPAMHGAGPGMSAQNGKTDSDDDLFAAFNKDTKVDNASHYPPPPLPASGKTTPALDLSSPSAWSKPAPSNGANGGFNDDDDPFGLSAFQAKSKPAPTSAPAPAPIDDDDEDDDLLGDLARPVDEVRKKQQAQTQQIRKSEPEPGKPIEDEDSSSSDDDREPAPRGNDPFDKAVGQIMEMGFSAEDATRGLTESGQGLNVQAAISYLLNDAHRKAKEKTQGRSSPALAEERSSSRARNAGPAWMDEEGPSRRDNRSPASGEPDFAKQAAAVGTTFLKTANKFWSAGQKKVQKAVAELQEGPTDPSQPKWMRSAQQDKTGGDMARRPVDATDEALMLESGARPGRPTRQAPPSRPDSRPTASRDQSPALSAMSSRNSPVPRWQQDPKSRLTKQAIEEQSSQAYVSPARRKKTTPQPPAEPKPQFTEEPDLLFSSNAPAQSLPTRSAQPSPRPAAASPQPPRKVPTPRPAAPARKIPNLDPGALQTSTRHRAEGTAHFKRGDYASAHASYSSSLSAVPDTHPLAIVLLCNRALTALKTGEPRQAVSDADAAIALIGPSRGEGEHVALQDDTGEKRDMKELYGKALTRKAEALEQMEKWADAGTVWQACVESGVGGPTAIAGRQRCQKALAPKPAATPKPATPKPAAAARRPTPQSRRATPSGDSEAVTRLQAANKAAEAADAEKFALADQVDARVGAWRDGKRENLRALLASLDAVLWEGSGWKKVGLHELVMANRVKIIYMKAIAKTHPDKVSLCPLRLSSDFLFLFASPLSDASCPRR